MYSEQMMREQGFDDAPNFRLNMYTDAIWRACRIILDVRMHRGEIGVDEAIRFMVEQTTFEEPNARAEVHRYTYTPDLPAVATCSARSCSSSCAPTSSAASGSAFSLRGFHDTLLETGSMPISFHRRFLEGPQAPRPRVRTARAAARARPTARRRPDPPVQVIPAIDLEGGRSRVVFWPGASTGIGAPTDRPGADRRAVRRRRARGSSTSSTSTARGPAARPTSRRSASVAARVAIPIQVAGGLEGADHIRLVFAAGATRVVLAMSVVDDPELLADCLAVAGDWLAVGLDPRPDRLAAVPLAAGDAAHARGPRGRARRARASAGSS